MKGGGYDSFKNYFNSAYIPATKGFTLVCEAMIKANDQFSQVYKNTVDNNSLQEDVLVSYISRLNSLSTALEELPAGNIFLSSIIENLQNVRQKTDEKLDKLREYNYTSVHIFDELESQLQNLEAGVMMLVEGKAWNQSTGTFSTMGLNLDWATDINQSWDARDKKQKALKAEAEKIAFEKELKSRTYNYVEVAGKRMWLWVKDPSKVTKDDLEFNELYKLFFDGKSEKDGIKNVLVNNQNEDWLTTIGIELKTGINASTGKPLTTNEKIQRWGILAGIVTTSLTAMFYNVKGTNTLKPPAKSAVKSLSKEEQLRQNVLKNIEESKKAREFSNFKEFADKTNEINRIPEIEIKYPLGKNIKKHISKHDYNSFKQQADYLSDSELAIKLEKNSFFSQKWSKEDINNYVEIAYNDLRAQGKTGKIIYDIKGEKITIIIREDGVLDTAYGSHKLSLEDFRK